MLSELTPVQPAALDSESAAERTSVSAPFPAGCFRQSEASSPIGGIPLEHPPFAPFGAPPRGGVLDFSLCFSPGVLVERGIGAGGSFWPPPTPVRVPVDARGASPRCPILRPGQTTETDVDLSRPLFPVTVSVPVHLFVRPRSGRQPRARCTLKATARAARPCNVCCVSPRGD